MAKLEKLVLENFKSYAGTQVIGPFDDFTCVVGPNGAGKSNLMDAISFVLGIQSRFLRSTTLKDLLFRKSSDAAPARKASVKLFYRASPDEIEGIKSERVVVFGRSISSAGVSSYQFEGKDVTFEAYERILHGIGVLVKIRNFLVFQGDVESIAAKSPVELTKLIEHVCGSDQLAEEYEALKQQRVEADEKMLFNIAKRKMFFSQLREVKAELDEANRFQQNQEELRRLQTDLFMFSIWKRYFASNRHEEELSALREKLKDWDAQAEALNKEMQGVKRAAAQLSSALGEDDKDIEQRQRDIDASKSKLNSFRSKLKMSTRRLGESESALKDVEKDRAEQQKRVNALTRDIAKAESEVEELQEEMKNLPSMELRLSREQLQQYSALKETAAAQTSSLQARLLTLQMDQKDLDRKAASLLSQKEVARKELAESEKLLRDYGERDRVLKQQLGVDQRTLESLSAQRQTAVEELKTLSERTNALRVELDGIMEKLQAAGDEKRRNRQEEKVSKAIATLQTLYPKGVHGRVVDLCRPIQKKYAQAVTIALGKFIDAVVVENKTVATDCINYLKEQRVGKCTFLPLDSLQSSSSGAAAAAVAASSSSSSSMQFRPCIDLIECSEAIKPAIAFAVENAVVCDSLDSARYLVFERNENVKAVTLQGHVVNPSGAMTGGSVRTGHDRWEEKELETLRVRQSELERELAQCADPMKHRQQVVELDDKLRQLQTKIQFAESDVRGLAERVRSLTSQRQLRQERLNDLEKLVAASQEDLARLSAQMESVTTELNEIEEKVFQPLSAQVGVKNFRGYEETMAAKSKDALDKYNTKSKELAAIKAQLVYEQQKDFRKTQTRLQSEVNKLKEDLRRWQQEEEELQNDLKRKINEVDEVMKNRSKRNGEKESQAARLRALMNRKNEIQQGKEEVSKSIATEEMSIENNKNELKDLVDRAEVERVSLTLAGKESSRAQNKVILKFSDKVHIDLTQVHNKYKGKSDSSLIETESELTQDLQILAEEISAVQPNLNAAAKYDEMLIKVRECAEGVERCKDGLKDIVQKFDDVRSQRMAMFNECFSLVSKNLSVIYKDLTKSSKHPLGGQATLSLDNMEEPYTGGILFNAMPPMKRYRGMEELSGGEKTVAALALLFSIHSYKPAPFFVLDEVDAALDNVNVKKVCNYIQQRSRDFQCIVISLKDIFFENADSLVGITRDVNRGSSLAFTLDLRKYSAISRQPEAEEEETDL